MGFKLSPLLRFGKSPTLWRTGSPPTAIDTTFGTLESGTQKPSASAEIYQSLQSAPMAIAPSWSQSLRYTHTPTPFGGDLQGSTKRQNSSLAFQDLLHSTPFR